MKLLEGYRALVTGGSGGIGVEIVRALANEGADVAIQYQTHQVEAEAIVEELRKMGRKGYAVQCDLEKPEAVREMARKIENEFGAINTLVNAAGINRDSTFTNMTSAQWDEVINVNLSGVYHTTKAFVEQIVESGHGRIVTISSVVGQMGNFGQVNYAAAKSGLIGFAKALARELAPKGTTVNVVAPGFIDTPMVQKIPDKVRQKLLAQIPMGRFGTSKEVARSVVYLVSPDADYITGTVLNLNGGMYL